MKALLTFCILLCLLTTTQAATRYVDPAAVGLNNGTSWTDAWQTIGAAKDGIVNGDTLYARGGTYPGSFSMSNKSNITILIDPAAVTPVVATGSQWYNLDNSTIDFYKDGQQFLKLTGKHSTRNAVLAIEASSYLTVRGVEVERQTQMEAGLDTGQIHGVSFNTGDNFTLENCYVHHTTGDGLNVIAWSPSLADDNFSNMIVRNNRFYYLSDDGVQFGSNKSVTFTGNDVDNGGAPALFGGHPDGVQFNPDGKNMLISGNVFKGFNQNIFVEYVTGNTYIHNNIMISNRTDGTDRGINLSVRDGSTGNFIVANNTFYNFITYQAINGGIDATMNRIVANNLFINCKAIAPSWFNTLLTADNYMYDTPGVVWYNTSGAVQSSITRYAGSTTVANPLLTNIAGEDFTIASPSSPLIGAGQNLSAYFTTDFSGTVRSLPYDSGAYEYGAAGTNAAPVVAITSPASSTTSTVAAVTFTGTATDAEDGALSSGITWTSSLDGAIGTGASVTPTLSSGTHTITASRTDSGALTATASIEITINPPSATFNVETLSVSRMRVTP